MKLKAPEGVGSINVAGNEYTAKDGVVDIVDPVHVAAAQANGFTEVESSTNAPADAPVAVASKGK